jgi:rhodanese-related sulfurtransferase
MPPSLLQQMRNTEANTAQIKTLIKSPSPSKILIGNKTPSPTKTYPQITNPFRTTPDVREPHEYETHIPTALNMPITSQPDALFLPSEEFQDRFGFAKPTAETEVIFYCKAGVRSSAAAQLARQVGYQNVGEYRGSWMDWVAKGGDVGRDGGSGKD